MITSCIIAILSVALVAGVAESQVSINHSGNDICLPGDSITVTMSCGLPYSNPKIWVNGVAHSGLSYTIQTSQLDNPNEYIYYGTITYSTMGQQRSWDSRVDGPARPGDLISIASRVVTIGFSGSYPLYERFWTSASGTLNGHDVPDPAIILGNYYYPASYQRSSPIQLQYSTVGSQVGNGVTTQYQVSASLIDGTDHIWDYVTDWTSCTPGQAFTVTTPAQPGYIYKHYLRHQYFLSVVFNYQPPAPGQRERRVFDTYDTITTPIYAVFSDPNATFPLHHNGDIPSGDLETRPWYELMDNAIIHITTGGSVRTVTTQADAMNRLTTDLYIYPNRPLGPSSSSLYDPAQPNYYAYNFATGITHSDLRFNLFGMMNHTNGDCTDFAAYLECEARCMGITDVRKIHLGDPFGTDFHYPRVKKCGDTMFNPGYFDFHQMTYWAAGGGIYDWAVAFPSNGTPDWYLSLGASQGQEFSAVVSSGTPTWSPTYAINEIDPVYHVQTLIGSYSGP